MRAAPCLLVIPLLLAGCASGGGSGSSPGDAATDPASLTGPGWRLDDATLASLVGTVPAGVTVTIAFADGNVSGDSGCNRYSGTYEAQQGGALTFGHLATTLMACSPERDALQHAYLAAIGTVTSFRVDGSLVLSGGATLTYEQETSAAPATLIGTNWLLTAIGSGGTASSVVAGTTVTLVLEEDGTVTGSAGCNGYHGTYTTQGSALTFGPLATTRKMCDADVMTQEHAFTQAMAEVQGYAIDGSQLTLTDAQGAMLLTFEGSGN